MIIIRVYSIWMGNKTLLAFLVTWLSVSWIPQATCSLLCDKSLKCWRQAEVMVVLLFEVRSALRITSKGVCCYSETH